MPAAPGAHPLPASKASPAISRRRKPTIATTPPAATTAMPMARGRAPPIRRSSGTPWRHSYGSSDAGVGASVACCAPHPAAGARGSHDDVAFVRRRRRNHLVRVVRHRRAACWTGHRLGDLGRLLVNRHLLAAMSQHLGHPDQFADEPIRASNERLIEETAVLGEDLPHLSDVDVPEDASPARAHA